MSKVDNVHQSDQVAGTVLSKEFYANKPALDLLCKQIWKK